VTDLEDSLRDYYATKADELSLPDRVFDSVAPSDDASVSYISIGPEPRRRTPMLLAAAASIVLIAGAGVLVSRGGSLGDSAVIRNASSVASPAVVLAADMPLLAPTWLPDGYELTGATDVSGDSLPRLTIYRDASLPLGSPSLMATLESEQPNDAGGTAITLQGRPARDLSANGLSTIYVTDPKGVGIRLSSRSLDIDAVRAAAETVASRTGNPSDGVEISDLPAGFTVVLDHIPSAVPTRNVNLEYGKPGHKDEGIVLSIGTETLQLDEFLAAFVGVKPEEAVVRGKTAYLVPRFVPSPGSLQLVWMESPGVGVAVLARGLDDATLKHVAEGLQPLSPALFQQMTSDHPGLTGFLSGPIVQPTPVATTVATPRSTTVVTTCEPQAVATTCNSTLWLGTNIGSCTVSDSSSGTDVTGTDCSKLTSPPLWATDIPAGFSLSKIDESVGNKGASHWHTMRYTSAGNDGLVATIDVVLASGTGGDNWAVTGPPDAAMVSMREVFLRGTRAAVAQDLGPTHTNPAITMSWRERPDLIVELHADSTSIEDLIRMAEGLGPTAPGAVASFSRG
jgi:hypothetical protein